MAVRIHVIDHDSRRRAAIARDLLGRGFHAEIYENLSEFRARIPATGYVLAHDDDAHCPPARLRESLGDVPLPIAFYAAEPAPERIVHAMHLGAWNYLKWPFNPRLLDSALDTLGAVGERLLGEYSRRSQAKGKVGQLTARERDVLELIVQGNSNKTIAIALDISPRTVEIHRSNMMRKLQASTTSDAVRIALYAGIDEQFAPEGLRETPSIALDRAA
jgi:FixJ family two-component response regulator